MRRNKRHRDTHAAPAPNALVYTTARRNANERVAHHQPDLTQRCLYTGSPIPLDFPTSRIRHVFSGSLLRPIPATIDSSVPFPVDNATRRRNDYQGAMTWTLAFERYIKHVLPRTVEEALLIWREWWRIPYVVARVTLAIGRERMDAVLALLRDEEPAHRLVRRTRHTLTWIVQSKSRATRLVRQQYLPYSLLDHITDLSQTLAA
jgi:hypothetical protein